MKTPPVVVLTRSHEDNAHLRLALQGHGIEVVEAPTAELRDLPAEPDVATVQQWCRSVDAIAFTSRHGVQAFCRQLSAQLLRDSRARGAIVAAVGRSTAEALLLACVGVDIQADEPSTGARLAIQLSDTLGEGAAVLAVQGRHARPELEQGLQTHGFKVLRAVVYENACPDAPSAEVLAACARADLIYVAAPSAASRLLAWAPDLRDRAFLAIGPTTAAELAARHALTATAVAASPDDEAALAAVLAQLPGSKGEMQ